MKQWGIVVCGLGMALGGLRPALAAPRFLSLNEALDAVSQPAPGPGAEDEIWLDAETLRYFLESFRSWAPGQFDVVLERVEGVRLKQVSDGVEVSAHFDRAFTVEVARESEVKNWELYAIDFPKLVTFRFFMNDGDGILRLTGFDRRRSSLAFRAKLPFLPDTIRLRNGMLDLETGHLMLEAGVVGNAVAVIAEANLMDGSFDGVDFWESLRRNLRIRRR